MRSLGEFKDWLVESLNLENQRVTGAILTGNARKERYAIVWAERG